jgi:hypothetical protein
LVLRPALRPRLHAVRFRASPSTAEKRMGDVTRQRSKRQDQLPPFLRDLLAAPPRAGEGVHPWLFRVARHLHAHLPAGEIIGLLENS